MLHRCRYEHKLDLTVLKHIENLIKKDLLRCLKVVVDVFENKKQTHIWMLHKVLLNFSNHLDCVERFHLALHAQGFAEAHQDFRLVGVQQGCVDADHFQNQTRLLLDQSSFYLGYQAVDDLLAAC